MNMNNSEKNKNKTDGRRSQLVVFMLFWKLHRGCSAGSFSFWCCRHGSYPNLNLKTFCSLRSSIASLSLVCLAWICLKGLFCWFPGLLVDSRDFPDFWLILRDFWLNPVRFLVDSHDKPSIWGTMFFQPESSIVRSIAGRITQALLSNDERAEDTLVIPILVA